MYPYVISMWISICFVLFHDGLEGNLKYVFLSPRYFSLVAMLMYSVRSIMTGPSFLSALLIIMFGFCFRVCSASVSFG